MEKILRGHLALLLTVFFFGSCSTEKPKKEKHNDTFDYQSVPSKMSVYFDISEIEKVDRDLKQTFGGQISWSLRLQDPGEQTILDIKDVSFSILQEEVFRYQIEEVSYVTSEVNAMSDSGTLLAGNGRYLITAPNVASILYEKCHDSGSGIIFVDTSTVPSVIKFQVCNVSSPSLTYSAAEGLTGASQIGVRVEPKTIAYKCKFDAVYSYSDGTMTTKGTSRCTYGYDHQPGEAKPILEVPTAYATGTPLYLSSILNIEDIDFWIGKAGQISIKTSISNLPFGSMQSCHSLKIDVHMASGSSTRIHRLDFFRSGLKGADTWTIKETTSTPKMRDLARYYRESKDALTAYLVCTWIPSSASLPTTKI